MNSLLMMALGWVVSGVSIALIYLKLFLILGIPGERSWVSLLSRVALCPFLWPLVLFYDIMTGDE